MRQEQQLFDAAQMARFGVDDHLTNERFGFAMGELARLRPTLDTFFDQVTVNDPDPALRRNRLRLLARVAEAMALAADFSRIEG